MKTKNKIDPLKFYWASFNHFEMLMQGSAVMDMSIPGDASMMVERHRRKVTRTKEMTPSALRKELSEYGAWNEEELRDDAANWDRIIWLAAGNINDEEEPDCSPPVNMLACDWKHLAFKHSTK